MSWDNRSYYSEQSGNSQYSNSTDGYGGRGQHETTGGKKRPSSRLKKSSGKKTEEDYPSYTTHGGDNDNYNNNYNSYGNGGYGRTPYNNVYGSTTPYYGGGGSGYNNINGGGHSNGNSSYSNDGGGYTGGVIPYNAPAASWAPQDGTRTRSPMFISTKEVNVYAMPGSQYDDGYSNDQRRRGGSRGFFRPAFEAVGQFFDRKFGFNDRD